MIHDAHHIVTGYSTSVFGEFQVAAWELGAQCYEAWQARLLCGFLMGLGLLTTPKQVIRAFKEGQAQSGAYQLVAMQGLLTLTLDQAQHILKPQRNVGPELL